MITAIVTCYVDLYVYRTTLTAIHYFLSSIVMSKSGVIIDPAMVKSLTAAEMVRSGQVTSKDGMTSYELYTGTVTPHQYSKLYSLPVSGDVKADVAVTTLESIKAPWSELTGLSV